MTAGHVTCRWYLPVTTVPTRHLTWPLTLTVSGIAPSTISRARASPLYDVDTPVALVGRRDCREVGDLLATVGGVRVEGLVIDADFGVWVAGRHGDLDGGRDDVGGRDVELEDGGVLEGECGLRGPEGGQSDENGGEHDDEDKHGDDAEDFLAATAVVFVA
ncbi:eukaryotic translation initiation factor 3subunit A [Striga asiatica]|uniref:Eukaryotic translation initiation factor 3subunit A n=1 Tax=Striga asiatica TaxID=4170 RepID=A0A5A7PLZ0_STRAF|nr:eukaryotic translation initiation factor 3subunit A [Striga asiatica]